MTRDVLNGDSGNGAHLAFHNHQNRLRYLELWRELGVRPNQDNCSCYDWDLLDDEVDDLTKLTDRCLEARRLMNDFLPPHELARDDDLVPLRSGIEGAGKGLFFRPSSASSPSLLCRGEIVCYYSGHLHDFHSRKALGDTSYLMLVDGDLFVDPGPLPQVKARFINDPLSQKYVNCRFVAQPDRLRCAVVATRDVSAGEELFVSYGDAYWAQRGCAGTIYNGSNQGIEEF